MNIGNGIFEVAMALVSVALIALLVNKSQGTAQVISSAGSTFNSLLQTVTLQNGGGMIGGNFAF